MSLFSYMLESTCTVTRPVIGRDSAEGVTQDFTNGTVIVAGESCSVQDSGASVQTVYAQRNTLVSNTVYFTRDVGAQVNDIVTVTDRTGGQQVYQVQGVSHKVFQRVLSPYSVDVQRLK